MEDFQRAWNPEFCKKETEEYMRGWLEILIVSANYKCSQDLAEFITQTGAEPHLCSTVAEAQRILQCFPICLVFSERTLPDGDFWQILAVLASLGARIPVFIPSAKNGWTEHLPTLPKGDYRTISSLNCKEEIEQVIAGLMDSGQGLPN